MTTKPTKRVRCAVYTRVSTEYGLDQEFNSLDAQHEAAEAYIRSQAHDGWTLIRTRYDDGGYSGGSTDRPALQRLLADIRDHRIDIVVVYKVDRLTRSLADFAKLVELFDAHGVSFVSVTQQFNTTTSMGRLTLNVLLSFAQFEREVTGERIRDKIGASKRKGLWVGGMVPLGYVSRDKKLFIEEEEAGRVRMIFRRYLDLGSIGLLLADLRERGIVTRRRQLSDGRTVGGIPFTRGPLAYLLRNRFYIGEVVFGGQICPAQHPPILDRGLFEAVQRRLAEQCNGYHATAARSRALLTGRIFDDRGNRMSPSHSRKGGARYGYYVSSALIQGRPQSAGSVARVPAAKVEAVVFDAIRQHIGDGAPIDTTELITTYVRQIEVRRSEIAISLMNEDNASEDEQANPVVLTVPWSKTPHRRHRDVIAPQDPSRTQAPPDPLRHPDEARHRDCARTAVAVRGRGRRRDHRRHRGTGGLQQAPRQHDDLAGLPGTVPRQGRRRRRAAARGRRRPPVRRPGRVVAPAPDARARVLTTVFRAPDHRLRQLEIG
jgi:site-specific DNA recombinase